jgi:hypothetical protein
VIEEKIGHVNSCENVEKFHESTPGDRRGKTLVEGRQVRDVVAGKKCWPLGLARPSVRTSNQRGG